MGRWASPSSRTTDGPSLCKDWGTGEANALFALATVAGTTQRLHSVFVKYTGGTPNSGTEVEVWYRAGHGSEFDALLSKDTIGPDKTFFFAPGGTVVACGQCRFEVVCGAAGAGSVASVTILTGEL